MKGQGDLSHDEDREVRISWRKKRLIIAALRPEWIADDCKTVEAVWSLRRKGYRRALVWLILLTVLMLAAPATYMIGEGSRFINQAPGPYILGAVFALGYVCFLAAISRHMSKDLDYMRAIEILKEREKEAGKDSA